MTRQYVVGPPEARLAAHLVAVQRVSGMTPCLEWQGSRDRKGYGRFNAGTGSSPRYMLAHRFAMEAAGLLDARPLLHACDNPPCCNVEHLRPGTLVENNRDMRAKGRHARGSRVGSALLTEQSAASLLRRHAAGETLKSLAMEYGVAYRTAVDVVRRVTWRHVDIDGEPVTS